MSRRMVRRVDLRPFVVLAVVLLVGTAAGRVFTGVVSVLVMATVAVLGSLFAVTVVTVRGDARRNASWRKARSAAPSSAPWWQARPPVDSPAPAGVAAVDAEDAA